jgi:hypothetical protein
MPTPTHSGLWTTFEDSFYTGATAVSSEVPFPYDVAIGGRPYMLDRAIDQFRHDTIPILNNNVVVANSNGEQVISRQGFWIASVDNWTHGAGQVYLDRGDSDPARFRSSKGINIWTRSELSLLQTTLRKRASVQTNLNLIVVGSLVYLVDGTSLVFTVDLAATSPAFSDAAIQAGEGAQTINSVCTDGFNIYAALGSNGIHTTTRGATSSTHYNALAADLIDYVNGRLMAAAGDSIYNIIASGAAPAPLFTRSPANTDFRWVGFAAGPTHIYAAGFSGDKSLIYKTSVKPDGTALDAPSVAAQLLDGEIVRSIQAYAGSLLLIGTDKGFRLADIDGNGNLTIGVLVPISAPVRCFEPQEKYVWFGWTNYDSTSTGLGRMDPSVDVSGTGSLGAAYASDLMATAQGNITSVVTFQDRRMFAVAADGFWVEDTANKVPVGSLDSGLISYGITESKVAAFLDTRYRVLTGTHRVYIAKQDGVFSAVGSHSPDLPLDQFSINQLKSEAFEIRNELDRDGTNTNTGPVLVRYTLKASPVIDVGEFFLVPVILAEVLDVHGTPDAMDVVENLAYLKALRRDVSIITYQELSTPYTVIVADETFVPTDPTMDRRGYQGTCILKLKRVA